MNFRNFQQSDHLKPSDWNWLIAKMQLLDHLIIKTIAEALDEFLIDKQIEECSPRTIRYYKDNITRFVKFIGGDTLVTKITPSHIKDYLIKSADGHAYAQHARYQSLKILMNWCVRSNYLLTNPVTTQSPKLPNVVLPVFTDSDVKSQLKACVGTMKLRDKAIILTFYDTGMRKSELAGMSLTDIEIDGRLVRIKGKGNKERMVIVSPITLKAIWEYLRSRRDKDSAVWVSEEGSRLTGDGIAQAVGRVMKRAGMKKRAGCHVFRHTFACNFLEAGGDSLQLKYLLGHTKLVMVDRYSRATEARRALIAQEKFSPVDRLGLK